MEVPYYPVDLNNLTGTCTGYEFLVFNQTNVPLLTPCTQINYLCPNSDGYRHFAIYNSTTGPAPSNCSSWAYYLDIDARNFAGPLLLPSITTARQVSFQGVSPGGGDGSDWVRIQDDLNVTAISLPDLEEIWGVFSVRYADKIESLEAPKLKSVELGLALDFSAWNGSSKSPPSIKLSFPSLVTAYDIWLMGNIDAVDLPVLNNSITINVTTTGTLDCDEFAKRMLNSSLPAYAFSGNDRDNAIICNSGKASVTTHRSVPTSTSKSGGERSSSFGVKLLVGVGIVAGIGSLL